ncbi:hypothetical protein [Clostridium sp.]|uniref:HEAT repeat domain-containing protein n=1 Tax=Clostridium sp. TaxID=1506 RepID=UPI00261AAB93|nr:hypothetical protein [Clostridium sp.]
MTIYWQEQINKQIELISNKDFIEEIHKKIIKRKLKNINQLICYVRGLDILKEEEKDIGKYLSEIYITIQSLAYNYSKKENMEKAFFAFFISKYPPIKGREYNLLMEILISYLDNSTIYCRENVLNALYALGNLQSVETAWQIINDGQLFHHKKLLSDGLIKFNGDKENLSEQLWSHRNKWDDNLMVAVVQFITLVSDNFKEPFFEVLKLEKLSLEIRLSILRYYRHHIYKPVLPLLLSYLKDENKINENIKIVTASVIEVYPSEETIEALKGALHHSNWYLRYNSAVSLVNLNIDIYKIQDVLDGKDIYAKEILTYMIKQRNGG